MRTNITGCDFQQLNTGTDLRCYPEAEKASLYILWETSFSRALIYCLTVIILYFILLGGIVIYETYQVYGSFSWSDMRKVLSCGCGERPERREDGGICQGKSDVGTEV